MGVERLLRGSFKGAAFLFKTSSTQVGRKVVNHDYPNDDRGYTEDLGKAPRVFNITAILDESTSPQERDNLIEALESKGPGILVHPFYGQQMVALTSPATIDESDTTVGEVSVSMSFKISDFNILPTATSNNRFFMNQVKNSGLDESSDYLSSNFEVTNQFLNFEDALNKIDSIGNFFQDNVTLLSGVTSDVTNFNNSLIDFQENVVNFVNQPAELAAAVQNLYVTAEGIAEEPLSQFDFWSGFFNFGDSDTAIPQTTVARIEKQKNRDTINDVMQSNSLVEAYNSVIFIDFENEDQLIDVSSRLEVQYKTIDFSRLTEDLGQFIKEMRVQVNIFLEDQAVSVAKIIDVTIKTATPAKVISHQYYGDIEMADEIVELNNANSSAFVQGDIKVLTNVD